jgi:hypothetical protein
LIWLNGLSPQTGLSKKSEKRFSCCLFEWLSNLVKND